MKAMFCTPQDSKYFARWNQTNFGIHGASASNLFEEIGPFTIGLTS
jgi:hypothetical protein